MRTTFSGGAALLDEEAHDVGDSFGGDADLAFPLDLPIPFLFVVDASTKAAEVVDEEEALDSFPPSNASAPIAAGLSIFDFSSVLSCDGGDRSRGDLGASAHLGVAVYADTVENADSDPWFFPRDNRRECADACGFGTDEPDLTRLGVEVPELEVRCLGGEEPECNEDARCLGGEEPELLGVC